MVALLSSQRAVPFRHGQHPESCYFWRKILQHFRSLLQLIGSLQAAGTIGSHITKALLTAGFTVTIVTRLESKSRFPDNVNIIRTDYSAPALKEALRGQDAAVSAVGIAGISTQVEMIDAAEAAGVRRFIVSDFGYGPQHRYLPEFEAVGEPRMAVLAHAKEKAGANKAFTWSAVAIGIPIDWVSVLGSSPFHSTYQNRLELMAAAHLQALKKFPTLGFDIVNRTATIYDSGTELFTGTTLTTGIGHAVVGALRHPDPTANKHLLVRSVQTCQKELLFAFEAATGESWPQTHEKSMDLMRRGREKLASGDKSWTLDLIVAQLLEEGAGRSIIVTEEAADNKILGMPDENVQSLVRDVMDSLA